MRKIKFLFLAVIIASLVGCSNTDEATTNNSSSKSTYITTDKNTTIETTFPEKSSDEESTTEVDSTEKTTEVATTIAPIPTTTIQPMTTTSAPTQAQTQSQVQPQQPATTEKQFVGFEEVTNENHEGGSWVVWSDGSKTDYTEIVFRRDLAEQLFSKLLELRRNEYQAYGFPESCVSTHWSEEVYELCKQRCIDIMDNFSHQGSPDYFGENIQSSMYFTTIEEVYLAWYNSEWHHYNLVVGGLSGREAVAAYQYNEVIYWVYLYGN